MYENPQDRSEGPASSEKKSDYSFKSDQMKKLAAAEKKKLSEFDEQMKRINFEGENYTYDDYPAEPLISFFPKLTRKTTSSKYVPETSKLRLPIPDTFVFLGKEEIRMWLLTSEDGYLEKIESFSNRDMLLSVGRPKGRENELTAVMKAKVFSFYFF
jgi:hypothetical protein